MAELFGELFCEEIPARMQVDAEHQFLNETLKALKDAGLGGGTVKSWSGPRRLAVFVKDVATRQPDLNEERRGPRADAPKQAIEGFLKGAGINRDQAEVRPTPKGDFLFAVINKPGRKAKDIIPELIEEILGDFAWPKSMRWGRSSQSWVRPLHRISVLFDGKPLKGELDLGGGQVITFGQSTFGHRMISPKEITLASGDTYEESLKRHYVIVDREQREKMITQAMKKLVAGRDLKIREDKGLMAEVVGLVEYPHPVMGCIDNEFMELPEEILIASMRSHQKYFAVQKKDGNLAPFFITITNMKEKKDRDDMIRTGNERVLRARLADADFFWKRDKTTSPDENYNRLSGITFFEGLKTMKDKADRLSELSGQIAKLLGANEADGAHAGRLAKADLVSETVGEFPELQGIIGGHLARNIQNKKTSGSVTAHHVEGGSGYQAIADAIAGHYKPEGPEDAVPSARLTMAVALADKIDTLVGFFSIGKIPTGSKDPYALRRSALGVLRIIIEKKLPLRLMPLFERAAESYKISAVPETLVPFMQDRLKVWMRDQGIRHDVVAAVLRPGDERSDDFVHIFEKAKAIDSFLQTEDGKGLMAGYRRASSILTAEEKKDGRKYADAVVPSSLKSKEEKTLSKLVSEIKGKGTKTAVETQANLSALGSLRSPIDQFFEKNIVNDEDQEIRVNRLNLLGEIRGVMEELADFSAIENQ
jgi:glycyl-tRNA synthetase beta chain